MDILGYTIFNNFHFCFWVKPSSDTNTFTEDYINFGKSAFGNHRIILAGFHASVDSSIIKCWVWYFSLNYGFTETKAYILQMEIKLFSHWSSFTFIVNNNIPSLFVDGVFIKNGLNPLRTLHLIAKTGGAIMETMVCTNAFSTMFASTTVPYPPLKFRLCTT